jgi:hypothetical protein
MTEAERQERRFICVYPGCEVGPLNGGGYLERVNQKGEPFEGACPDHYWAVVRDEIPDEEPAND